MINWLKKLVRSEGVVLQGGLENFFSNYANNTSGIAIDALSILGNPTVFRGVNLIAGAGGKIPLKTHRYTEDGSEPATALPLYRMLLKKPHPFYTAYVFKHTLIANALIYGESFVYINRNDFGLVRDLMLLDNRSTQVEYRNGQLIYKTTIGNTQFAFPYADVLHIKGLSLNGITGVPLLDVLSNAYGYGLAVQRYSTQYYRNNCKPSIVIELAPHYKDPEKIKEFRRLWTEQHNQTNSHAPAFLTSGNKVVPYSNTNDQSQLIESMEHDIIMVANALGVPASKLGSKQNTSYSSLESESTAFLQDIDCWLVQIEQEFEDKLLTESAKINNTHYIQFEREALIKIDSATQSKINIDEYNNGIISFEEMRQRISRNKDKNGSMEWRRPSNIIVEGEEQDGILEDKNTIGTVDTNDSTDTQPVEPTKKINSVRSQLDQMTILTLDRLTNRLQKSNDELKSHRSIFIQSLSPFENAATFTDTLFKTIEESENPKATIANLDSLKLLEKLCTQE